jgi:hypothetical protein
MSEHCRLERMIKKKRKEERKRREWEETAGKPGVL